MRTPLMRATVVVAGTVAFSPFAPGTASAEQSVYCVFVPSLYAGVGPRPMSTQATTLCIPWP